MAAIMCTSQGCRVDEMNEHTESTQHGTLELISPWDFPAFLQHVKNYERQYDVGSVSEQSLWQKITGISAD